MRALAEWPLGHPFPDPPPPELARPARVAAIAALEVGTAPADPHSLAVALDGLLDYAETFGLPVPNRSAALMAYIEAMRDMPADLVVEAVARVKREWRANRMPAPAIVRGFVADELAARKMAAMRLRTMDMLDKPAPPAVRPDPAKARCAAAAVSTAVRSTRRPAAEPLTDEGLDAAKARWTAEAKRGAA